MDYARLVKMKAFVDYYNGLSDDDKRAFAMLANQSGNKTGVTNTPDCRQSFVRGVGENVVGNAVYYIGASLIKALLKKI
jgi:hypothetical protein